MTMEEINIITESLIGRNNHFPMTTSQIGSCESICERSRQARGMHLFPMHLEVFSKIKLRII